MSVLDELKALNEQRDKLLEGAKNELLKVAQKALAELNELGFDYSLVEGATRAPRKAGTQAPKRQARDVPCPICEFKTQPHHDGRMHRSQKKKKPFTVEELMGKGLTKIGGFRPWLIQALERPATFIYGVADTWRGSSGNVTSPAPPPKS